MTWQEYKREWLRLNACHFCKGSRMHTCTSYSCKTPLEKARKYLEEVIAKEEVAQGKRKYVTDLASGKAWGCITGAWITEGGGKKEMILQFRGDVPGMVQAAVIEYAKRGMEDRTGLGRMHIREWQKGDGETVKDGIPKDNGAAGQRTIPKG